jgi:hypothetical protein
METPLNGEPQLQPRREWQPVKVAETLNNSRQKVLEEVIKVGLRHAENTRMKDAAIQQHIRNLKGSGGRNFAVWALDSGLEYEHAIQRLLRAAHIKPQGGDGYSLTALGVEAKLSLRVGPSRGDAAGAEAEVGCLVCSSTENPDSILICDGCESEYHLQCLQPALTAVPTGDWFCATCRAVVLTFPKDELGMTWTGTESNLDVFSFEPEEAEYAALRERQQKEQWDKRLAIRREQDEMESRRREQHAQLLQMGVGTAGLQSSTAGAGLQLTDPAQQVGVKEYPQFLRPEDQQNPQALQQAEKQQQQQRQQQLGGARQEHQQLPLYAQSSGLLNQGSNFYAGGQRFEQAQQQAQQRAQLAQQQAQQQYGIGGASSNGSSALVGAWRKKPILDLNGRVEIAILVYAHLLILYCYNLHCICFLTGQLQEVDVRGRVNLLRDAHKSQPQMEPHERSGIHLQFTAPLPSSVRFQSGRALQQVQQTRTVIGVSFDLQVLQSRYTCARALTYC